MQAYHHRAGFEISVWNNELFYLSIFDAVTWFYPASKEVQVSPFPEYLIWQETNLTFFFSSVKRRFCPSSRFISPLPVSQAFYLEYDSNTDVPLAFFPAPVLIIYFTSFMHRTILPYHFIRPLCSSLKFPKKLRHFCNNDNAGSLSLRWETPETGRRPTFYGYVIVDRQQGSDQQLNSDSLPSIKL